MLEFISGTSANLLVLVIGFATFAFKAFAFVDAVLRPTNAYVAAGKLTKVKWCAIAGVALLVNLVIFNPLSFLNIIGDVAAIVYLVDVRPALRALGDGGAIFKRRPGGSNGPSGW